MNPIRLSPASGLFIGEGPALRGAGNRGQMMIAGLPEELIDQLTEAWTAGNRDRATEILEDVRNYHLTDNATRLAIEYLLSDNEKLAEILTNAGYLAAALNGADGQYDPEAFRVCARNLLSEIESFTGAISGNIIDGGLAEHILDNLADGGIDTELVASIVLYRAKTVLTPAVLEAVN